ncbi:hypothetical protein ACSBR1_019968 [Camellia fascicularis]
MESTLRQFEVKPIKGESKTCATSLESRLDFVHAMFGLESEFRVVSTIDFTESTTILQNYTILEDPLEIFGPKMVACHTMPYPYAIFYCHDQESERKVFKVILGLKMETCLKQLLFVTWIPLSGALASFENKWF